MICIRCSHDNGMFCKDCYARAGAIGCMVGFSLGIILMVVVLTIGASWIW